MRKLIIVMVVLITTLLGGCSRGHSIEGIKLLALQDYCSKRTGKPQQINRIAFHNLLFGVKVGTDRFSCVGDHEVTTVEEAMNAYLKVLQRQNRMSEYDNK